MTREGTGTAGQRPPITSTPWEPPSGGSVEAPGQPQPGPRSRLRDLSLRNRMALLIGLAVTATVAVVAGVALAVTGVVLRNSIDHQLVQQAEAAADSIKPGFRGQLIGTNFGLPAQIILPDGNTATWRGQTVTLPVGVADNAVAQGTSGSQLRTVTVAGRRYRVATVPLHFALDGPAVAVAGPEGTVAGPEGSATGPGALQLARDMSDVDRTLRELGLTLLVVGLAGVAGSVLLGRLIARASLKPVDAAAAAAEEVARTQDLSALIPVTGTDEIARLANSLNSMLRALEASRARQRQLVDDASHELRTPLTSLRTNIELLLRAEANPQRALPTADRDALLRDVDAQIRELSGLVSELVELARDEAQAEDVERADLTEIVHAAAERVRRRAKAKDVQIVVAAEPSPVDGRPNMLERAVTNLLDNAVKFSPPQGRVQVDVGAGEVLVTDEGPGIAPEDRPRVFNRFYRATSARGLPGSGLGLAIVADAAAVHGGSVRAEEGPGGGARLRLSLPVSADMAWSPPSQVGPDLPGPDEPDRAPGGRDELANPALLCPTGPSERRSRWARGSVRGHRRRN